MPLPIHNSKLEVYLGHDEEAGIEELPDVTIPSDHINEIEISARIDEIMDEASISLHNIDDRYTEQYPLRTADRLVFRATVGPGDIYGGGYYGGGWYGGATEYTWTGRIIDVTVTRDSPTYSTVEIAAQDYAGNILANRQVTNSYIDRDVGHIIRDIIDRKAPEVDTSAIPDLGVTTDVKYSSAGCWDAILSLAARADAITIPDGQGLHIHPIAELPQQFDLKKSDYYLPLTVKASDDIKNVVRVDSGENRKLESSQEAVDAGGFVAVTANNRLTHRLRARKAEVHSVELYVQRRGEDDLTVRLQSDQDGAPVDIDDEDSDITSTTWQGEDLPDEGWHSFFFDSHTLADRDPWLIIESDGSAEDTDEGGYGYGEQGYGEGGYGGVPSGPGQFVGHNAAGELAFRAFYPHPLNFEVSDPESIRTYGTREKRIERDNLKTLSATRDAARAELAKTAWPSKTVEFDVRSIRAHLLHPGDRVTIDAPEEGVTGEHIISEVTDSWQSDSTEIETSITAEWRRGILSPQ